MIFKSPYADVDIPNVSLQHYILSRMVNYGDKPALIDGPSGRTLTYAQLVQMINGLANGLQARGFGKGDVFAVLSPNIPEYPVLFHGVGLAGGITTTMNPLYAVEEIVHQLEDSSARYLITVPPFVENALAAAEQVNSVEEVFVFGEAEGATPVTALFGQSAPEPVEIDPAEDLVVMPYSSGTTGLPKGVMLTHRNMVANIVQLEGIEPVTDQDVIIAVLPMFHIYGMELIINVSLANGATIVTMPRFDMAQFLQLVQDHKVTKAHLVPPILLGLAKHPVVDQFDTTSVRVIVSGAAPLDAALGQAVAERLGCIVKQGYGLTETSPVLMVNPDDKPRDGTVGPAVRGTEFMIVGVDSGEPLGPGQRGELWARGPQVMKGYLNNPEATAASIDGDGWFRTGDIAEVDEDGYVAIVDRVKELIKYKGYSVAPARLEGILIAHPAILDAAVIPSPDEEAGEVPKAFVVVKEPVSEEDIMAYVAEHVAPQERVRRVAFIEEVPKSASGKILRRVLIEQERAAAQ